MDMRRTVGVLSALLVVGLITACGGSVGGGEGAATCRGEFEATVHQGPNAGLELIGELEMNIEETGSVSGTLIGEDGEVPVVGQADGRAINLVFDLGDGRKVFGVGAAEEDLRECEGDFGGPLEGPDSGDLGGWRAGYALGG